MSLFKVCCLSSLRVHVLLLLHVVGAAAALAPLDAVPEADPLAEAAVA